MTVHGQLALQKTIYQTLTGNADLASCVSGVFDKVPQRTVYPYIYIDSWLSEDWSSVTTEGLQHDISLHIWSRQGGKAECVEIIHKIHGLLHLADLTITAHKLILLRCVSTQTELMQDGITYRGVMRLFALTQNIS